MANALSTHGCFVTRLFNFENIGEHAQLRIDFENARRQAPELKQEWKGTTDQLVVGAFGADGIPSTYHNIPVRKVRNQAWDLISPVLANTLPTQEGEDESWYIHELFDRSRWEKDGTKIGGESWHKDSTSAKFTDKQANNTKKILGGWVNMSKERVQKFSFLTGTHKDLPNGKGFYKCKGLSQETITQKHRELVIPPGYAVIFYQHITHEIAKGKVCGDSLRLHLGFCISQSDQPLFPDQLKWITEQGVPRIPSNQIPPMHSGNHASFPKLRAKLPKFAERFNPVCVKEVVVKSGKCKGETYSTVGWGKGRSFGYSLKDLEKISNKGIKRYREYSQKEKFIMMPTSVKRIKSQEN